MDILITIFVFILKSVLFFIISQLLSFGMKKSLYVVYVIFVHIKQQVDCMCMGACVVSICSF